MYFELLVDTVIPLLLFEVRNFEPPGSPMSMYLKHQDFWFYIYYCKAKYPVGLPVWQCIFALRPPPASIRDPASIRGNTVGPREYHQSTTQNRGGNI